MKIDLGAGMVHHDGYINIDIRPYKGIDYVLDIGKDPLPFNDNTVDEILCDNVYEHLTSDQLFFSIEECFRVLKPTGFLEVRVPKFGTRAWNLNPDHKMHWTEDMFGFFLVPDNEGHIDPNGYLKGFWRVEFIKQPNIEAIWARMYPNKPECPQGYVLVTRADQA